MRIGFQLLAASPILAGPFLKIGELAASAAELLRHRRHGRGHVLGRLIDISGQRPGTRRVLPQLPGQECLADTRVTVNVEQETAPLIINGESQILLILDYLPLATDETALLAIPD